MDALKKFLEKISELVAMTYPIASQVKVLFFASAKISKLKKNKKQILCFLLRSTRREMTNFFLCFSTHNFKSLENRNKKVSVHRKLLLCLRHLIGF